jgi:hypothetical protein
MNTGPSDRPQVGQVSWHEEEIAEISLLVSAWQAAELVSEAALQRMTVGQLLRSLIRQHLGQRTTEDASQAFEVLAR